MGIQGDVFETNYFEKESFDKNSIDILWCDFGVGSKIKHFISNMWQYIKPGGYFICHSTITNRRTRVWLDDIRNYKGKEFTGINNNEYYVEMSFLEPHKFFQNSITILQRRDKKKVSSSSSSSDSAIVDDDSSCGISSEEPIYS